MDTKTIKRELKYQTSRSSGKGGQHVNKVETRVELFFDVDNSEGMTTSEKNLIREKLQGRISNMGLLQVSSQAKRSQLLNRQKATNKFFQLLEQALTPEKERIPTKPTKSMEEKRLKSKRIRAEKKALRGKVNLNTRD